MAKSSSTSINIPSLAILATALAVLGLLLTAAYLAMHHSSTNPSYYYEYNALTKWAAQIITGSTTSPSYTNNPNHINAASVNAAGDANTKSTSTSTSSNSISSTIDASGGATAASTISTSTTSSNDNTAFNDSSSPTASTAGSALFSHDSSELNVNNSTGGRRNDDDGSTGALLDEAVVPAAATPAVERVMQNFLFDFPVKSNPRMYSSDLRADEAFFRRANVDDMSGNPGIHFGKRVQQQHQQVYDDGTGTSGKGHGDVVASAAGVGTAGNLAVVDLSPYFAAFRRGEKFLVYPPSGDGCAGPKHYEHSLTCELAEAEYLGRTLVFETTKCFLNHGAFVARKLGHYVDLEVMSSGARILPLQHFWTAVYQFASSGAQVSSIVFREKDVPTSKLAEEDRDVAIIVRDLTRPEGGIWWSDYGFEICDLNKDVLQRNHSLYQTREDIFKVAYAIAKSMSWDYDAVHVRRGDKAENHRNWPNLDRDTRPDALLEKLPKLIPPGRNLFISTDEDSPGFFDPLKGLYAVRILMDFTHLWGPGSEWYAVYEKEMGEDVEFDQLMWTLVDYALFSWAKTKVETFNDLTDDPRHGVMKTR